MADYVVCWWQTPTFRGVAYRVVYRVAVGHRRLRCHTLAHTALTASLWCCLQHVQDLLQHHGRRELVQSCWYGVVAVDFLFTTTTKCTLIPLCADDTVERKREEGEFMLYWYDRVAQAPYAHLALLLIVTMLRCVWVAAGLDTANHSDCPFNQLKAALNCERHVVDERGSASVSLTSVGLSFFIKTPAMLASFIQEAFSLRDGSRITQAQAMGFAGTACAHFLPPGTCVVALPVVPRCTTPMVRLD